METRLVNGEYVCVIGGKMYSAGSLERMAETLKSRNAEPRKYTTDVWLVTIGGKDYSASMSFRFQEDARHFMKTQEELGYDTDIFNFKLDWQSGTQKVFGTPDTYSSVGSPEIYKHIHGGK